MSKALDRYMTEVLSNIDSKSIREWTATDHNAPLIRQMAEDASRKKTPPVRFASYLVCIAMGF